MDVLFLCFLKILREILQLLLNFIVIVIQITEEARAARLSVLFVLIAASNTCASVVVNHRIIFDEQQRYYE